MTTLFVATTGGHLTQLEGLADRLPPDGDALWMTPSNAQSTSLLAGRDVEFIHDVNSRDLWGVLRCVPIAHRLWRKRKPTRVVSTGSGIAVGVLPYLALRGVECHYIESAARVSGPSLTGRILRWAPGVRVYTQHPYWARGPWHYGGSQFDRYEAVTATPRIGDRIRVVVTVGGSQFPFRRLIAALVPLLASGGALERALGRPVDVLWQTGAGQVADLPIDPTPFLPAADLKAAVSAADIVISHAGTGSVVTALDAGRSPVLIAREARHGEATDDHQRELAGELDRRGLARHRDAGSITPDDLMAALTTSVRQRQSPAPFALRSRSSRRSS
ncbi:glycosyltransferase [Saccharopolyspora sp. NPDC002686]|uniref:glycosyltransferase n=1 Tax=Saccharopolyspora sp. NPDC002686 TaxID=3154541 RepID=UPI00331DE9B4